VEYAAALRKEYPLPGEDCAGCRRYRRTSAGSAISSNVPGVSAIGQLARLADDVVLTNRQDAKYAKEDADG